MPQRHYRITGGTRSGQKLSMVVVADSRESAEKAFRKRYAHISSLRNVRVRGGVRG